MITVYHDPDPSFGLRSDPTPAEVEASWQAVAMVDTSSLDQAFTLTNTIDRRWWENPAPLVAAIVPSRSTSVGDVLKDEQGRYWLCARVGWKQLQEGGQS